MQKLHLVIISLIVMLSCSNSGMIDFSKENRTDSQALDIEGNWKFVSAEIVENSPLPIQYPQPIVDEVALVRLPYIGLDLRFEKDSMYELDYPISINERKKYSIDSGYLFTYFERQFTRKYPIEKKNDTLWVYKLYDGEKYIKESYVKISLNDSILNILLAYGVNYPELAGTWFLIREHSIGDGSEYILNFPFKIPDSLIISREELIQATQNKMLYKMPTNGKNRDYVLSYHWGSLELTPSKWYKRDDPWIHFSKKME